MNKQEAFVSLFSIARKALRVQYAPSVAREIEHAFRNDQAEIICIAARDLQNALRRRGWRKVGGKAGRP